MTTYYEILGVAENATPDQIKKGYRAQAAKFHPDRNPGRTEWSNGWMQRINEAYRVLSDPYLRNQYDSKLRAERGQDDAKKQAEERAEADYKRWQQEHHTSRESKSTKPQSNATENFWEVTLKEGQVLAGVLLIIISLNYTNRDSARNPQTSTTTAPTLTAPPINSTEKPIIPFIDQKYGVLTVRSSLFGGGIFKDSKLLLESDVFEIFYQDPAFPDLIIFQHHCAGNGCGMQYVLANIRTGEVFEAPVYGKDVKIRIRQYGSPEQTLNIVGSIGTDHIGDSIKASYSFNPMVGWVHLYANPLWVRFFETKKYPFDFFADEELRKPLLTHLELATFFNLPKDTFKVLRESSSVAGPAELIDGRYALLRGCTPHDCGESWTMGVIDIVNHSFHFINFSAGVFQHQVHSEATITSWDFDKLEKVFYQPLLERGYHLHIDRKAVNSLIFKLIPTKKK